MDNFKGLRIFIMLAEHRSFAKVAEIDHAHPSSVSRKLKELESALGVRLLQRTTRSVALTVAGQALLDRVKPLLTALEAAQTDAAIPRATARGHVKVAAPVSFSRMYLAPMIQRFQAKFPLINITLVSSNNFSDLISEGFDVAVRISESRDSSQVARTLMKVERIVCASPGYLEKVGKPTSVRDLKSHNCVISDIKGGGRWYYRRAGSTRSLSVSGSLRANQGDVIVEAVKCGLGVGLLPLWLVKDPLRSGALTRLFPEYAWGFSKNSDPVLQVVYPHRKAVTRAATTFIDFAITDLGRRL